MTRSGSVRAAWTRRAAGAAVTAAMLGLVLPGTAQAARGAENGWVAFGRFDPAIGATSLWVAGPDGHSQRRLTHDATYFSDWSPDGSRLAFDFEDSSGVHIATIAPNGSDRRVLTSEPGVQEAPKWSPDGRWITYDSYDPAQAEFSTSIWVMRADGSHAQRVTADGFDVEPVFSPDGTHIAFGRLKGDSPQGQLEAVHVVNVDGSGLREVVPARPGLEHPDWSPDGRWITFNIGPEYANAPDSGSVLAVRPHGWGLHVIRAATDRYSFFKPVWSPDGRKLLLGCFDTKIRRDLLCTSRRSGGRVSVVDLGDVSWVNFPAWGSYQG